MTKEGYLGFRRLAAPTFCDTCVHEETCSEIGGRQEGRGYGIRCDNPDVVPRYRRRRGLQRVPGDPDWCPMPAQICATCEHIETCAARVDADFQEIEQALNEETLEAIGEVARMKADPSLGKSYTDVDGMIEDLLGADEEAKEPLCYLVAKHIDRDGCIALRTVHGKNLVDFKKKLICAIGDNDVQLITISRPSAYGEYEPYRFVESTEEFECAVMDLRQGEQQ